MSNETKPNVRIRAHGRDYVEQVANDQVHKILSEATAEAALNLVSDGVEQALDLAFKAHNPEGSSEEFRAWLEPVRERASQDLTLSPGVYAFISRYLV